MAPRPRLALAPALLALGSSVPMHRQKHPVPHELLDAIARLDELIPNSLGGRPVPKMSQLPSEQMRDLEREYTENPSDETFEKLMLAENALERTINEIWGKFQECREDVASKMASGIAGLAYKPESFELSAAGTYCYPDAATGTTNKPAHNIHYAQQCESAAKAIGKEWAGVYERRGGWKNCHVGPDGKVYFNAAGPVPHTPSRTSYPVPRTRTTCAQPAHPPILGIGRARCATSPKTSTGGLTGTAPGPATRGRRYRPTNPVA